MFKILSLSIIATCLSFPNLAQADICSRDPEVLAGILRALSTPTYKPDCASVLPQQLQSIEGLSRFGEDFFLLPGEFANLSNLKRLYLSGNSAIIQADVFNDTPLLESVVIRFCKPIGFSSDTFSALKNIKSIGVNSCNGQSLHGAFRNLPSLESVSFGGTMGSVFSRYETVDPDMFLGSDNLKTVHIRHYLRAFPVDALRNLKNLTHLGLSGTKLTDIPAGSFANLASLKILDLSSLLTG